MCSYRTDSNKNHLFRSISKNSFERLQLEPCMEFVNIQKSFGCSKYAVKIERKQTETTQTEVAQVKICIISELKPSTTPPFVC